MKIVVFGSGKISLKHIHIFENRDLQITIVSDWLSDNYQLISNYKIFRRNMINHIKEKFDYALISGSHDTRVEDIYASLNLLKSNGTIFIEKPLVPTFTNIEDKELIYINSLHKTYCLYNVRYHLAVDYLIKLINIKSKQNIYPKEINFVFEDHIKKWYGDRFNTIYNACPIGGGVINTSSHEIDLMLYFCNLSSVEDISIKNSHFSYHKLGWLAKIYTEVYTKRTNIKLKLSLISDKRKRFIGMIFDDGYEITKNLDKDYEFQELLYNWDQTYQDMWNDLFNKSEKACSMDQFIVLKSIMEKIAENTK